VKEKLDAGTVGRDIVRYGTAIFLTVALGVVQLFVIPRRVDMTTYGAYRLFLVYAAYVGVLHLGLADGAFLRWAGQPPEVIRHEWPRVAGWIFTIGVAALIPAIVVGIFMAPMPRLYVISLATCALAVNAGTLIGYALQAAGDFRGAGRLTVVPSAFFVIVVLAMPSYSAMALIAASIGGSVVAALIGAMRLRRIGSVDRIAHDAPAEPLAFARLIGNGLPVFGANLAANLSQFADRILVSVAVPVATFALYGFASTVMVTSSSATQALSRVALSHAARRPVASGERARFLGGFCDLIAAGFGLTMAGVPLFEHLVARALPLYVPALLIVRALVLGAPFWVAIHVVLVGTLQSHGLVRRQFAIELGGLAIVVVVCGVCLLRHSPLWVVAAGATASAVVAWLIGVEIVKRLVDASAQPSGRFFVVITMQSVALIVALTMVSGWIGESLVYVALSLVPTMVVARAARSHDWR
jgi:O-antigen/teichoic acid export membrane protein